MFLFGATGGIRTPDRSVRSRVLYPAELRLHNNKNNSIIYSFCQQLFQFKNNINFNWLSFDYVEILLDERLFKLKKTEQFALFLCLSHNKTVNINFA